MVSYTAFRVSHNRIRSTKAFDGIYRYPGNNNTSRSQSSSGHRYDLLSRRVANKLASRARRRRLFIPTRASDGSRALCSRNSHPRRVP